MQIRLTSRGVGILQTLASGFCFGFLGIFGKTAFERGLTPGELLSFRYTVAGILLLGLLAIVKPSRLRLSGREWIYSILLGTFGYALFSFCFFKALTGLSASLTVLLLYIYPILVPIGAWVFLGERIARERWFVLPLAMVGLVLLVAGELYVENAVSFAFGIASAVFYSIYILCSSRMLANTDTLASTGVIQLAAGLTLCALNWRDPARVVGIFRDLWPMIFAMAIICSIMAMTLFLAGLKRLQNWEVSVLSIAEPVTGVAIACLFLHERLSFQQSIGAVMVIAAFIALSLPTRAKRRAHVG